MSTCQGPNKEAADAVVGGLHVLAIEVLIGLETAIIDTVCIPSGIKLSTDTTLSSQRGADRGVTQTASFWSVAL